ncbi:glycine cleavage system protein GcvH [Candidatus Peregrinibacteria bacterium]|nr:glycine cleavage system protein GcvH [Candidatus Peregrinibacteria bacterium]
MEAYKIPDGLYYTKEHEWVKIQGDTATCGITDYAQHLLTDVVFVELPAAKKEVKQFGPACVVESVKSVSDVYAPVGGTISKVNSELESAPELINNDPYEKGWIFQLSGVDVHETSNLMDAAAYKAFIEQNAH